MRISMNRMGEVVVAGEGTYRVPMGADERDNTLSNPALQAEMLREEERAEFATLAAIDHQRQADAEVRASQNALMRQAAEDYQDYVEEGQASIYGGEHPLTYIAALQSMAGNDCEQYDPLNGYLMSQDGVPAFDRTMSGRSDLIRNHSMGDWLSDLTDTVSQVADAASDVSDAISPSAQAATPTTQAVAPVAPKASSFQTLMKKKVAGIPLPLLALAAVGGGAFLVLRKK